MRLFPKKQLALALAATIAVPSSVFATNGYFLIGYGAKSRSMGGVGVAYGQDAIAAGANPAAMADVDIDTMRIDFGGEYFRPKRSFRHNSQELENFPGSPVPDGGVNHRSGSNDFLIPSGGGIYKFNRKLTMGMAVIGAGANSRYDQTVPGNPTCIDGNASGGNNSTAFNFSCLGSPTVGVNLIQMQMLPSIAYKVDENQYVGASLAIGVQTFRAYGLQAFGVDPDTGLGLGYTTGSKYTNQGNDWSYGAGVRFGWLGKFLDKRLTLGANYSSRVYMTKFDDYEDLFAEQGSFDIPENWTVGLAFKATDNIDIAFDYQKIYYSDVASIGNPGPNPSDPVNFFPPGCTSTSCLLGKDDGMGFGWDDADVYKVGINYDYNDQWSFRAGWNYAESPIKEDQVMFNFLAPAVTEHHLTLGGSYRPSKNIEWSFNYSHAFSNTIKGQTVLGPTGSGDPVISPNTNGSIDMEINTFGVSFGYLM